MERSFLYFSTYSYLSHLEYSNSSYFTNPNHSLIIEGDYSIMLPCSLRISNIMNKKYKSEMLLMPYSDKFCTRIREIC